MSFFQSTISGRFVYDSSDGHHIESDTAFSTVMPYNSSLRNLNILLFALSKRTEALECSLLTRIDAWKVKFLSEAFLSFLTNNFFHNFPKYRHYTTSQGIKKKKKK